MSEGTVFENLTVSHAPHIGRLLSTRRLMLDVVVGLLPAVVASIYYFRLCVLVLVCTCVVSAVVTELLCSLIRRRPNSVGDLGAVVTGLVLALSLPPHFPVWAAVIGSCFAIAVGKMVFGGLGMNVFNPAMVGRAFLAASFGVLMTTWTVPATISMHTKVAGRDIKPENVTAAGGKLDALTQATPLAWSKLAIKNKNGAKIVDEQLPFAVKGEIGGCLGETCVLAILVGGIYMLVRRTISIHIPLAVLLSSFAFAAICYLIDPDAYVNPFFHLASGGLLLGAFFIATDPVTAPLTTKGMWIFGVGVGVLTMLIRIFGVYPEGLMYAVLLMNALTALIDRFCKRIPIGGIPR